MKRLRENPEGKSNREDYLQMGKEEAEKEEEASLKNAAKLLERRDVSESKSFFKFVRRGGAYSRLENPFGDKSSSLSGIKTTFWKSLKRGRDDVLTRDRRRKSKKGSTGFFVRNQPGGERGGDKMLAKTRKRRGQRGPSQFGRVLSKLEKDE